MRLVKWQTTMNFSIDGGGTTRLHLTEALGLTGQTLCGRTFPVEKGWPTAVRYCKTCVQKSGLTPAQLRDLNEYVPLSVE